LIGLGYLAAGGLLLSVAAGLGGYFHGLDAGKMRQRAVMQKQVDAAHAAREATQQKMEQAALRQLEADQSRKNMHREIVRENLKIIERPVYRTVCIDDDGLRLLDAAAANANGESAGAPAQPPG